MATPARRHRWLLGIREQLTAGADLLDIEVEEEVRLWLETLADQEFAAVLRFAELLAVQGRELTEPYAKRLESGVLELRPGPYRITYWFPPDRPAAVLLTAFRKRRDNDRPAKERAYRARKACEEHHGAPGEHDDVWSRSVKEGRR
ncbi:type II toxin-antitoxin system RelE/ParE family toxin [Kitasatospora sp. NPDC048194]|uniref:type II toxin-antitoxin system RelE/ParE family toxin n=1 Tax=Kitasatospora sp. NPDC048194 TaxID=3364045 RepID=UPI0037203FD7